eukprot:TRINITY_DN35534_c0_g1_i1.p1 TRINITY_DN35534_c0_g1~~TRINITY_DN35534_c0_g1_i1.p1  ORF type:complete len:374 (+),score=54.32 TRINITY_DN35534_c0_g1_i1:588-1709(+)
MRSPSTEGGPGGFLRSDSAKLAWCVLGVVGTLVVYGVMQERIMKFPYGPQEERFTYSLFIVLCNRILTCTVAIVVLLVQGKSMAPVAPLYSYAGVSLSNVVATTCQYEALKYVSFPLQTLAKSGKMIPVMVWGTAIMQKKYNLRDYLVATTVTIGCAIFLLAAGSKKARREVESTVWGITLMLGYLGFDGFTSTFQDKLFKGYNMETFNQILYVTMCSSALSLIGLLSQGGLVLAIEFVLRNPQCLFDIVLLSLAATTSQFFISYTIRTFGALVFATIMTTRQLLSILLSCIVYGPPLNIAQLSGTVLVFASLYYKTYTSGRPKKVDPVVAAELGGVGSSSGTMKSETEPLLDPNSGSGASTGDAFQSASIGK